jgi:outer membrane protein TolC
MIIRRLAPGPWHRAVRLGLLGSSIVLASQAGAAAPDDTVVYGLSDLLARALQHNPTVEQERWKIEQASADLTQARAAHFLPHLRLETVGGLVPDAKGDVFNPPSDTTGLRGVGPFGQAELEFVQPLYTFGLLSNMRDAAAAGVKVAEAARADAELKASLEVKELYYGLLLAKELETLASKLSSELKERSEEVDLDDPTLPLSTGYKLKLASLELDSRLRGIRNKSQLVHATLAWRCAIPDGEEWQPQAEHLVQDSTRVPPLDSLIAIAAVQRPEWRQLNAGISARRSLESAATSAFYPQIFLAGGWRFGIAPDRTDQHNPFVKDDFNFSSLGMFIGMRQSFEWGLLNAKRNKARAQLLELKSQERAAAEGIRLDVSRAHADFVEAEAGLEASHEGRRLGRQWISLARDEYEFTEEAQDLKALVSAFEGFAETEQAYHQAVYDYNVALARLERAVGVAFTSPSSSARRSD